MFGSLAKTLFGSSNDRYVKSLRTIVAKINALEPELQAMSDEQLSHQTAKFREQLANGTSLDDILPEAFATVREASVRVLGMRHFDVQMIGGIVLHRGEIAEMRTGEGKTLVATLGVYLNALPGKGIHVITVNDYLAARDAEWMGRVYRFLGMTVGVIVPDLTDQQRRDAYNSDITYGTNNEFGFDYLRDNMKYDRASMVQRPFAMALIDEVDSVLIDEARTPLIISGPTDDRSELYKSVDVIVKQLVEEDYEKDEKQKSIMLTEDGTEKLERMLEEAVAEARGDEAEEGEDWSPEVSLNMSVLIPNTYVPDLTVRLGLYRRLATLVGEDELESFTAEMVDRFGPLPEEAGNLLRTVAVKGLCKMAGVARVEAGPKGSN